LPPSREDIVGLPAGEDSSAIAHMRISTDSLWPPAGEDILELLSGHRPRKDIHELPLNSRLVGEDILGLLCGHRPRPRQVRISSDSSAAAIGTRISTDSL
jgi:hypothetical protein